MRIRLVLPFLLAAHILTTGSSLGQINPGDIRDDLLNQFNASASKVVQLSVAIPAELYAWAPGEGVMSIATVYAHIARYNYMYLAENVGVAIPRGVEYANLEDLTNKDDIVTVLEESIEYARIAIRALSDDDLLRHTTLYGRDVAVWSVLVQLVSHMNEHVGQSVAYARINGVVPPWSS